MVTVQLTIPQWCQLRAELEDRLRHFERLAKQGRDMKRSIERVRELLAVIENARPPAKEH